MQRLIPNLLGLWICEDDNVPLTSKDKNGVEGAVLFWKIAGHILVHPDRMEMFMDGVRAAELRASKIWKFPIDRGMPFALPINERRQKLQAACDALTKELEFVSRPEPSKSDEVAYEMRLSYAKLYGDSALAGIGLLA